jgi:hypothetical protein
MSELHDIFLSHSHRDEKAVRRLAERLRGWEFDIYVDFSDSALQEMVDRDLAERLKTKIRDCRLFLFALSSLSVDSRWMPWELGLAHGAVGRVALWPLDAGAKTAARKQGYLNLYPDIDPAEGKARLEALVAEAKRSSVAPAQLEAMEGLGAASAAKAPQFGQPDVFSEFVVNGPMQLYMAWINALLGKR